MPRFTAGMSNFIIQVVSSGTDNFINIHGAATRSKNGISCMPSSQTTAPADRSYDRFDVDPAIQQDAYKDTDRVVPYSIHTQFLIRY